MLANCLPIAISLEEQSRVEEEEEKLARVLAFSMVEK